MKLNVIIHGVSIAEITKRVQIEVPGQWEMRNIQKKMTEHEWPVR